MAESVKLELDFLLPLWKDYGAERSDIDVLIDGVRQESRELLWLSAASRFKQILLAGETIATGPGKGQTRRGPEAALEHMQRIKALDIQAESNELSGRLHENTHAIEAMLRAYLNGQQTHVRLGFSRIDPYWVVNFGKVMVVAGAPGDGKTTFVNSVVYNLLKAGERVLYICTSDHSPEETWQHFVFLFAKEFRQKAYLPTLAKWKQHDTARPTIQPIHLEHMLEVLTAIRERRGLPGTLDVQRFFSFEEIKSYFEANNEKQHYSVVVIDYLGNMQPVIKDARDSKAAWEALSKDVLRWTAEKNVVTIMPSQVNREANNQRRARPMNRGSTSPSQSMP